MTGRATIAASGQRPREREAASLAGRPLTPRNFVFPFPLSSFFSLIYLRIVDSKHIYTYIYTIHIHARASWRKAPVRASTGEGNAEDAAGKAVEVRE